MLCFTEVTQIRKGSKPRRLGSSSFSLASMCSLRSGHATMLAFGNWQSWTKLR